MKDVKLTAAQSNKTRLVKGRVVSDTNLVQCHGEVGKMAGCLGCIFAEDLVEKQLPRYVRRGGFQFYTYKMESFQTLKAGRSIIYGSTRQIIKSKASKARCSLTAISSP